MPKKISNDTYGIRIRDFPACRAVTQTRVVVCEHFLSCWTNCLLWYLSKQTGRKGNEKRLDNLQCRFIEKRQKISQIIHGLLPNIHPPSILRHVNYLLCKKNRFECVTWVRILQGVHIASFQRQSAMTYHVSLWHSSTSEVIWGAFSRMSISRAHKSGQNHNTRISVFLIYETAKPVLIPVLQKQTFFLINFEAKYMQ